MDFIKQQNNTFPENYSKTSIKHKSNKLKYTFLFAQRFETGHKLNKKRKQKYPTSSLFKFQKPDSLLNLDTRTPRTRLFKIQISIPIVSNLVTGSCSSPLDTGFDFPGIIANLFRAKFQPVLPPPPPLGNYSPFQIVSPEIV